MSRPGYVASERGAAMLIAILIATLLAAMGAGLVALTTSETALGASYRHVHEVTYGAEAGIELALHELATVPDWSAVLATPPANRTSVFIDVSSMPTLPDGRTIDLASLTRLRQRDSDAQDGADLFGPDSPQWRLFAHLSLGAVFPAPRPFVPVYVVVWVADDGLDGDGDPAVDANRILLVRSEAFGHAAASRAVEVSVRRSAEGILDVLTWRADIWMRSFTRLHIGSMSGDSRLVSATINGS
jgi:hypothetical protein